MDGGKPKVVSYDLLPIDDTIVGDRAIADEIEKLKKSVTQAVFASRGYSIDQPLADGAARPAQHVHRHRRQHAPRQPLHRRLQKRDEGGHRLQRQRADARQPHPRKVGRADRLRRVRRGAPRRRGRGQHGRQRPGDRLLHRPGSEASARLLARGQPDPPRRVVPPRLRHALPLRPVAPAVRCRHGHRAGRPRSRLQGDRHQRQGRAPVQPDLPPDARSDHHGHPQVHQGQAGARSQEQGRSAAQVEGRGTRAPRQHARSAAAAGHDGCEQCRHRDGEERRPRDQGMAGDHGSPPQSAGQEPGRTCQ